MSAPEFGFSAGAFIVALHVIAQVTKALREVGGTSDDYRSFATELDQLKRTLELLNTR